MKFRKKPVVIEAIQSTIENIPECIKFMAASATSSDFTAFKHEKDANGCDRILIITLEGIMQVTPGDWIIRGVKGELYPCKPDIFEATYEEVNDV